MVGTVLILLLQLQKLRHRKTVWLVQGHITVYGETAIWIYDYWISKLNFQPWWWAAYWFSKLGRLLPWNPVKRTAAAKGSVSWSSAGDVSSCASFWHICGILRECGTISTILRLCSCLRAPAYTVWLQISCAVFVYPPGLPRPDERSKHPSGMRQRNKSHKTDNSEGSWSCFPFCNFPCMKAFSVCSLIHLSPIILKVTNVYWTLWPCAMLWANCLVMASLILHNRALM